MNSLKNRYSNRAARAAQFLILWIVLASSAMFAADTYFFRSADRVFLRAEILTFMSLPKYEIYVPETGATLMALPAKTALLRVDSVVSNVQIATLGSLVFGLIFATLIFWILAKTMGGKSADEHLRGSKIVSAKMLKKQIEKREKKP